MRGEQSAKTRRRKWCGTHSDRQRPPHPGRSLIAGAENEVREAGWAHQREQALSACPRTN